MAIHIPSTQSVCEMLLKHSILLKSPSSHSNTTSVNLFIKDRNLLSGQHDNQHIPGTDIHLPSLSTPDGIPPWQTQTHLQHLIAFVINNWTSVQANPVVIYRTALVSSLKDLLPCLHKGVAGLGLGQCKLNSGRLSMSEEERFSNTKTFCLALYMRN